MFLVWEEFFETVDIVLLFLSKLDICTYIASAYRSYDVFGVAGMA